MPNTQHTVAHLRMKQQTLAVHSYFEESLNYATHGKAYTNKVFLPYRVNCVEFKHLKPVVSC